MITVIIPEMILDYDAKMHMYCYRVLDDAHENIIANFYIKEEELEVCEKYKLCQQIVSEAHN